jgi:hypothetical protein
VAEKEGKVSIEMAPAAGGSAKTLLVESALPAAQKFVVGGFGCLRWSHDWWLIFCAGEGQETSHNSLWQARVDPSTGQISGQPRQLVSLEDFSAEHLTATADGKILAFLKGRASADAYVGQLQPNLSLSTPRRFTLDTHHNWPQAWSRDNRTLYFVSDRNGKRELFKQALDDTVPQKIASSAAGDIGSGNGLSPDGSWILYWDIPGVVGTATPPPIRLMRQPVAGGPPETVLEMPYADGYFANFSCPANSAASCVFQEFQGSTYVFSKFDPLKGKGELLGKIGVDRHWGTGWALSPDAKQIAVVDHSHKDRIEILSLSNGAWHDLPVDSGWGDFLEIAWAADAKGFFIISFLPQNYSLFRVSASGKVQLLFRNKFYQALGGPVPSSDGKYLAFYGMTVDDNVWLLQTAPQNGK